MFIPSPAFSTDLDNEMHEIIVSESAGQHGATKFIIETGETISFPPPQLNGLPSTPIPASKELLYEEPDPQYIIGGKDNRVPVDGLPSGQRATTCLLGMRF